MILGVPKETKGHEYRVAMTPAAVAELVRDGHTLLVETAAGRGAGWEDRLYRDAGARIVARDELFHRAGMIVKVKEPQAGEYNLFRPGQILFTFLHLAAYPSVMRLLLRKKVVGIGYETVQLPDGSLPLLAPMSEIAGKLSVFMGINYLRKDLGGKGCLLGGVAGEDRGRVVVVGAGHAGRLAAITAHALGAEVTVLDLKPEKLKSLGEIMPDRLETAVSSPEVITKKLREADLVIGAVLVAGRRAPRVVTRAMIEGMEPGSVIVDISIDQGGCIETSRTTTLAKPVFTKLGVIHSCVANLPSLVPQTSSEALCRATFPYVKKLADLGFEKAMAEDGALKNGLNVCRGEIVLPALL